MRLLLIAMMSVLAVPICGWAAPPIEIASQAYEDLDLSVTTMQLADGSFHALVADTVALNKVNNAEDRALDGESPVTRFAGFADRGRVVAEYRLDPVSGVATFTIVASQRFAAHEALFDYRSARLSRPFDEIMAEHTVRSISLSALLLWEDHVEAQRVALDALPFQKQHGDHWGNDEVCNGVDGGPACTADPGGCSGWLVPQSCAGTSIVEPCNRHDRCYQCGSFCFGTSRLQCDQGLRTDIRNVTGSWACGAIYFWGVRGFGWLFYQYDALMRMALGHDIYSLGLSMSACEGQYAHFCTVYVF